MQNKVLGILVTYNPDILALKKNIELILTQVSKLYIVDNNSNNISQIESILDNTIELIKSNVNLGLGKAYNIVLEKEKNNFEFFVTFDQDTLIPDNTIFKLKELIFLNKEIGVIGPIFSRNNNSINQKGKIQFKHVLIQSCAMFRMRLYRDIGGFNEEYFIDSVDFEYCLRILRSGYKVAIYNGIVIHHELGTEKRIGNFKYVSHNAFRNYYIARNHKNITLQYIRYFPLFIIKKNIFFFFHFVKIVFLERDINKIKSFVKGLFN
jgi:rhamnosyltransferase